ncbi:MAG: hypothetical protein HYV20_07410 [Gemmatimonadetes bacterium]|nr:hypothetical protein [Gemmatimonadota bacterium]
MRPRHLPFWPWAGILLAVACDQPQSTEPAAAPFVPPGYSHVGGAASELVSNTTHGFYNLALGTVLDGTQPQFPIAGDPTIDPAPEPDLSAANAILGDWLSANPLPLNANWSGPQAIPSTWALNTETAVIYEIDGGPGGIDHAVGHFGVDNGIFVWANGGYKFGALAPGGAVAFEYSDIALGELPPGLNYVQILREDHGVATGYHVRITGIRPVVAQIDIKPGSDPNAVNCKRAQTVIPVALLTTDEFNIADVDAGTVSFGPAGATEIHANGPHPEDADGDGDTDLVFHFRFGDTGLSCGDTEAALHGRLQDTRRFVGVDAIRTVP